MSTNKGAISVLNAMLNGESKQVKNDWVYPVIVPDMPTRNRMEWTYHNSVIATVWTKRPGSVSRYSFNLCGFDTFTTRLRINLFLNKVAPHLSLVRHMGVTWVFNRNRGTLHGLDLCSHYNVRDFDIGGVTAPASWTRNAA